MNPYEQDQQDEIRRAEMVVYAFIGVLVLGALAAGYVLWRALA